MIRSRLYFSGAKIVIFHAIGVPESVDYHAETIGYARSNKDWHAWRRAGQNGRPR